MASSGAMRARPNDFGSYEAYLEADKSLRLAKTVNTVKAAEIAQVTVRTIYNWMRSGRVDYVRTAGNGVRIFVDSLLREVDTDSE